MKPELVFAQLRSPSNGSPRRRREEAGLFISISSGFRSDAEQAAPLRRAAHGSFVFRGAERRSGGAVSPRESGRLRPDGRTSRPAPVVVLNRVPHDQRAALALPNSPMGAGLALGGREARGELGLAVAELADL